MGDLQMQVHSFFLYLKAYCFDQRLTIHSSSHSIQCISHVPSTFMNNALGEEERINLCKRLKVQL